MTIYVDILIILNFLIDYFLILASSKIIKKKVSVLRLIFASLLGGISSLYIFVPQSNIFFEILTRIVTCSIISLVAFGFKNIKYFLRCCGTLFIVTCSYGGIMIAVWYIFKPKGMVLNNSVTYFNISPLILILISVISYFVFILLSMIFSKNSKLAEKCDITVSAEDNSIHMNGIIDTGNSIRDIFGGGEVIITEKSNLTKLFGSTDVNVNPSLKSRYRIMPCGTVSGGGTLEGFRCDAATISNGKETIRLEKPILAISKIQLGDDYSAIVNPDIFM